MSAVALRAHSLPPVSGGKFVRVLLPHLSPWCHKIEYANQQEATAALLSIWANKVRLGQRHRERSCYRCPHCRAWHLTSEGVHGSSAR